MPAHALGQNFLLRVAKRIARKRRARGVTQEELAHRLRTPVRVVQRFESGEQNLTLLSIYKIAEALGVSPEDLIVPPPDPPSET